MPRWSATSPPSRRTDRRPVWEARPRCTHPEQMLDSLADGAERARRTLGVATASVSVWERDVRRRDRPRTHRGRPSGIQVAHTATQVPLDRVAPLFPYGERRCHSTTPGHTPHPHVPRRCPRRGRPETPSAPAKARAALRRPERSPTEPAARTARAAGGRSSPPASAPAPRTRARTRRGCPRPPAARTPGGRPRAPRPTPRATRC